MNYDRPTPGAFLQPDNLIPYDRLSGVALRESVWLNYERSKAARQPYDALWAILWDFWRGNHWEKPADSNQNILDEYRYAINKIYENVEHIVALLTGDDFDFTVKPTEANDVEFAQDLSAALQWSMTRDEVDIVGTIDVLVRCTYVLGTGILKTIWDPDAEEGEGNIFLEVVDPFRFYPELEKTELDKMSCVTEELFLDVNYIRRRWGKEVAGDADISDSKLAGGGFVSAVRGMPSATVRGPLVVGSPFEKTLPRARVLMSWVRDFVLAEHGIATPEPQRHKAKHPNWYLVYTTRNDILEVADNPTPGGKLPYTVYRLVRWMNHFYGFSEVQPLCDPQRELNARRSAIALYAARHAEPKLFASRSVREDIQVIASGIGGAYVAEPGEVWHLPVPSLSPEILASVNLAANDIAEISGISKASRGIREPNISAGITYERLQEKAEVRPEAHTKKLEWFLRKVGRLASSYILRHWTQPRLVRMVGAVTQKSLVVDLGKWINDPGAVMKYDVDVEIGSSRRVSAMKEKWAPILFQLQAIDRQALLEMLEIPDSYDILQRMDEREREEKAMALAAQTGQQPQQTPEQQALEAQTPDNLPEGLREAFAAIARDLPESDVPVLMDMMKREVSEGLNNAPA